MDNFQLKYDILNKCLNFISNFYGINDLINTYDDDKYNYWMSDPIRLRNIINFINRKKSGNINFLDLGSGIGFIFKLMPKNFTCVGYEIQDELICIGNKYKLNICKKNILELKKEDISNFDVIYIFEPLKNKKDCEIFTNNLIKIINNEQLLIYSQGGMMGDFLKVYFNMDIIENCVGLYHLYMKP